MFLLMRVILNLAITSDVQLFILERVFETSRKTRIPGEVDRALNVGAIITVSANYNHNMKLFILLIAYTK